MASNQRHLYRRIFSLCIFITIIIIVCATFFSFPTVLRVILDLIGLLVLAFAAFFTSEAALSTLEYTFHKKN